MAVTPNYGWPVPVATDYVKDGWEAISDLGNAIDTTVAGLGVGLKLVKTQSVGTAVSSVAVTNAFSTTYNNYRIIWSGGTQSTTAPINLQLGASTTGYSGSMAYGQFSNSSIAGGGYSNQANFKYVGGGDTNAGLLTCDLFSPFLAQYTRMHLGTYLDTSNTIGISFGVHAVATSYTDLTIIPASGTMTGGTVYVYGYVK